MPIYEYRCKKCGHRFEKLHQSFSEPRVRKCPQCGGAVEQLLSAPAAHFKGEGWYVTDYARKGAKPSESDSPAAPAKEPKPETKAAPKPESRSDKKPKK